MVRVARAACGACVRMAEAAEQASPPALSLRERLARYEKASQLTPQPGVRSPNGHGNGAELQVSPGAGSRIRSLSTSFSNPVIEKGRPALPERHPSRDAAALEKRPSGEVGEVEVESVASVKALKSVFKQPAPSAQEAEASGETNMLLDFRPQLERVEAHDQTLTWLDWTANRTFIALSSQQKSAVLLRLASGRALETIILNSTQLDNANGSAIAQLLRRTTTLRGISLAGNDLLEGGLLEIAQVLAHSAHAQGVPLCVTAQWA